MIVRLAAEKDRQAVLELARMQVEETLPHLDFCPVTASLTFDGALRRAEPTIFVAEHRREVIGHLVAFIEEYAFTSGIFTVQEVLYVRPDKRGLRAAAALLDEFRRWSRLLEAREMIYGISNGRKTAAFTRFVSRHTGAQPVGHFLKEIA